MMALYVHSLDDDFLGRMFAKHKSKLAFKTAIAAEPTVADQGSHSAQVAIMSTAQRH